MNYLAVMFFLCFVSWSNATQVKPCSTLEKTIDNLPGRVKIGNCHKPPCRLRKDSFVDITLKFKADEDISDLSQTVNANILGIPFPFVGVDGTSACDKIFDIEGKTKVGCNLKNGKEYEFRDQIEVLKIYPKVKTVVHWGLTKPDGKDVICFEVPARITN